MQGGYGMKESRFSTNISLYIGNDTSYILTMADQWKVDMIYRNSAIFNHLERPETHSSRSRHSLTLNISQTARDTNRKSYPGFRMVPSRMTLSDI